MLLSMMTGGSFSPRALLISNTIIGCLAYFPPFHLSFNSESNLSGNSKLQEAREQK